MDIYKDSAERKAYLDVPVSPIQGSVVVKAFDTENKEIYEFQSMAIETLGKYSVSIPFSLVDNHEEFFIDWRFNYSDSGAEYPFSRRTVINVITPILSVDEVKSVIGNNKSDAQAREAEKLVRTIISAHTGQSFSSARRTYKLDGNDRGYIELPNRLLDLESFDGFAKTPWNFKISNNGWSIRAGVSGAPGIKADYYGYHRINGRVYNEEGVLPEWFMIGRTYSITGIWGWREVPTEVKEAAKILLKDYACDDSVYRDRYVESISAVDWKIQFNTGAYEKTGNVKADQLLSNFVLSRGWAVI